MPLTRRIIAERIAALAPELQQLGVSRVALFGSYLRDAATPDSDVDLLVDFKPGRKTFRSLVSLTERLEGVLDCRVEAVTVESLSPHIGPRILAEAVDVLRRLSAALGGSLEDFACDLVPELLEKYWAMVIESAGPEDVTVGDEPREFDVVVRGRIEGRPLAVVCETKAKVSVKEVKRFLGLVGRLKQARPTDDIRPLFFGYKAERRARKLIVASGAAMVFTRGVMIPAPSGNPPVTP